MGRLDDSLLEDEIDDAISEYDKKKRKRKRRRKRRSRLLVLLVIVLVVFYFIGDLSKVKQLRVVGNSLYTEEQILSMAGLDYETRYILTPKFWIKSNVSKGEFIKDVVVHKTWDGSIRIEVQEVGILGYFIDGEGNTKALARDGKVLNISGSQLSLISKFPLLHGFAEESLESLAHGFNNIEVVSEDILQHISEITPYQTSYDQNMVKIVMQDGNILYSTMESLYLLNGYSSLMKKETQSNQCYFLEGVNRAYNSLPCSEFESN